MTSVLCVVLAVALAVALRRVMVLRAENRRLVDDVDSRVERRTTDLRASEARFEALVRNSSDVVSIADGDGTIRYVSPAVSRVLGHDPARVTGRNLSELVHPEDWHRTRALVRELPAFKSEVAELRLGHADGQWRQTETTMTNLLQEPAVRGVVLNTRDVTESRTLAGAMRDQALHDSLTGLANRTLFQDRLDHSLAQRGSFSRPVAVLYCDLDGFKAINDSYGHACGDEVLVAVAERLAACVRGGDTVARLGGDEFAVLLEHMLPGHEADPVALRIAESLNRPYDVAGRQITLSLSMGIAVSGEGATPDTGPELLRNAHLAMEQAKGERTGVRRYEPGMHATVLRRVELASELRGVVERDELVLHYQPTVDLTTGAMTGVEALLRWAHPQRGLVPPLEFIPIAEETGLIVPIGAWVLRTACREAVGWQSRLPAGALGVAVNVAARQLLTAGFIDTVEAVLAETGLSPRLLTLELTESALIEHSDALLATLERLRSTGVRIAIDDFGTGYSSLSYLHRFPLDVLKIDRSFVVQLAERSQGYEVARGIVELARGMQLATVAEGVEDVDQVAALRELRCDVAQGYYFARPLPVADLSRLIDKMAATPAPHPAAGGDGARKDSPDLRRDAVEVAATGRSV